MLNETLQIISMVLCLVGFMQVLAGPKMEKTAVRFHFAFYITMFIYSAVIITSLVLKEISGEDVHFVLKITVLFEFITGYYLTYLVISWLLYRVDTERKNTKITAYRTAIKIVFAVQTAALLISLFTDYFYEIDDANQYHRKSGFWLLCAIWIVEFLFAVFILVRYGGKLSRKSWLSFAVFAVTSGAAFLLQMVISGIYFISFAASLCVLVLYLFTINESTERYYEKEREIGKLRVDIMLSQIQPHFLFNSLTTIKYLCRHDPETAERAVAEFSRYLRGNMDSLNSDLPIPFSEELEHTNAYLSLEKLRFGDDLNIIYHIESEDFDLPALTLQPIVENAVRHGIREKKNGKGSVTISAREYDDRYEITVSDDGDGFDYEAIPDTDDPHIGIENVRYRLKNMCGGTLTFDSAEGCGTDAVISIPKEV